MWYQNKRQNEKRRQFNNNENEPLTFVETSFDSGAKIKRTTNFFKSRSMARQSPKTTNPRHTAQPLTSASNQVFQKVPPSPVETLPKDIKPTGKGAMSLSSLLCSPPQIKNRALWERIAEEEDRESDADGRARGALIARKVI